MKWYLFSGFALLTASENEKPATSLRVRFVSLHSLVSRAAVAYFYCTCIILHIVAFNEQMILSHSQKSTFGFLKNFKQRLLFCSEFVDTFTWSSLTALNNLVQSVRYTCLQDFSLNVPCRKRRKWLPLLQCSKPQCCNASPIKLVSSTFA